MEAAPIAGSVEASAPGDGVEAALRRPATLTAIVAIGVALRVVAWVANTPLWLDEILLSRNILELPLGDLLLRPLYLDQVAPRGFLLMEHVAVALFGAREWALRLFPFICGIATLFLFRRLAERLLAGLAVQMAVALFAIGLPFIKFTAEVKQYAGDALVAVLLTLLAVRLSERDASTRELLITGVAAFVIIWFSQASVVVMGGIGVALSIDWLIRRDRASARRLFITVPFWAAASLIAVFAGLRSMTPATREFMDNFWREGFFPQPMQGIGDLAWFYRQLASVFTDRTLLVYDWAPVFVVVSLIGLGAIWKRRRVHGLILVMPIVVAMAAAIAHQYPFRGRLMFYLVPTILLGVAAGAESLRLLVSRAHAAAGTLVMLALLTAPVLALVRTPPPYNIEHHREVLAFLQARRQAGDALLVFPLSRIGTLFYGPQYGIARADVVTLRCNRRDTRAFLRDADQMRGRPRVWLLSSQAGPFRTARPAVRRYFGTIGMKRDSLVLPSLTQREVSIELYDLSDPVRLVSANAESFPVDPMPTDPPPGCRPWAMPEAAAALRP